MEVQMKKKYMGYIFPSMLSFLLTGIYSIVDGIFVGRALGDPGLAAINIAWPLVALITSLGTGIGIGASVIMSLNTGAGNHEKTKKAEGNAFFLLLSGSLLLVLGLYLFGPQLLTLLGAKDELFTPACTYLHYILLLLRLRGEPCRMVWRQLCLARWCREEAQGGVGRQQRCSRAAYPCQPLHGE